MSTILEQIEGFLGEAAPLPTDQAPVLPTEQAPALATTQVAALQPSQVEALSAELAKLQAIESVPVAPVEPPAETLLPVIHHEEAPINEDPTKHVSFGR